MPTYTDPVILDSTGQDIVTGLASIAAALPGGNSKADKTDLASIQATGTTNLTGAAITSGKYFYLNGVLVQAKEYIDTGAPFTENTNYQVVTAGALNELKSALQNRMAVISGSSGANGVTINPPSDLFQIMAGRSDKWALVVCYRYDNVWRMVGSNTIDSFSINSSTGVVTIRNYTSYTIMYSPIPF